MTTSSPGDHRERDIAVAPPNDRASLVGLPGHPRRFRLLVEAVRGSLAHATPTVIAALVVAIVCAIVLVTTGRVAAGEREVIAHLDSAGTRLVVVSDADGAAGLDAQSLPALSSLPTVSWALGLGPVTDVYNSALEPVGTGTPSRPVYGDVAAALGLDVGRAPLSGEAVAGSAAAQALGLQDGLGGVRSDPASGSVVGYSVVGGFTVAAPLDTLDRSVLAVADAHGPGPVRYVYLMARSVADVASLEAVIRDVVVASDPSRVTVETPAGLIGLREVIGSDLAANGRQTMLLVLGVGLGLVLLTMLGAVAARKRDFGRRRALGASRSAIVVLVVVQALLAGVAGAIAGTGVGLIAVQRVVGELPNWPFSLGVAGLALVAAIIAAIPPALIAACQDPVRILRVP